LQNFGALDNSEVTGLSINDKKQHLVSVGWNKAIAFYSGFSFDVVKLILINNKEDS